DTHHMMTVVANFPLEADMWIEAMDAKYNGKGKLYGREEWDQLPGTAVTDVPAIVFSEDLIAAYPDAKVILTTRDLGKWWTSCAQSLQTIQRTVRLACWIDISMRRVITLGRLSISTFLESDSGARKKESKASYIAHY
ncbi:hypothetical protein C8R43DRAFT_900970, partial [Mycena crocata]